MTSYDEVDIPKVQVASSDATPAFAPTWKDRCYEYSETRFYRNTGGTLTVTTRLTHVDEYGFPPEFDVIVTDLEVFDDE